MTHQTRSGLSLATVLAVLVALAVGAAGGYFLPKPDADEKNNKARARTEAAEKRITALGRIQPAGGVVPVFGPPGDQIVELSEKLTAGAVFKKGDVLGKLKSAELRTREVAVADIQLKEADAALKAAEEAGKKRIAAARAELAQAKASEKADLEALEVKTKFLKYAADTAAKQVKRVEDLKAGGVRSIADEDIEKAKLQQKQAEAEHDGSVLLAAKTRATYKATIEAADAKIAAAEADLEAEKAKAPVKSGAEKLELARQMAGLTVLRAPIDGKVLKVVGRVGQPTGLEPVAQMANLDDLTAVTEVYESDVKKLREWLAAGGVKAEVTNPALGEGVTLTGVVASADVSQMIARNTVFAMGPREDADRRVVEVVAHLSSLTPDQKALASGLVGLQVTVVLSQK